MSTVSLTPTGTRFARYVKALAVARGDAMAAYAYAQSQPWQDTPEVLLALKAATTALSTDDATFRPIAVDFAEFLRALTIIGKLSGLRPVPFDTRMVRATTGASAAFVGEGYPVPGSASGLETITTLSVTKVAGLAVLTAELMRTSKPKADAVIVADVAAAIAQKMDAQFIDPSMGGVTDISPASVTYGATQISSGGTAVAQIDVDLASMVGVLTAANMPLNTAAWIMHPLTATNLALKRGSGGSSAYPQITARGGFLAGLPVITSTACVAAGSPTEKFVALVEAGEIAVADDGGAEVEFSTNAALEMSTTPAGGATALRSLWQNGLVGIKATRYCNWQARRSGAAAVLRDVNF